jgi:NAD(P)H dehydrogenase (quinone)
MVRPSRILIVFYSRYGNTAKIAEEIAYGAKEVFNIQLTIRRIADGIPIQVISKNPEWTKVAEDLNDRYPTTPITLIVNELPNYDAIIFGSPTRFGNMAAPMKAMWDATSELWTNGSLIGKVGAVFYWCCFSSWRTRNHCGLYDVSDVSSWDDLSGSPLFNS